MKLVCSTVLCTSMDFAPILILNCAHTPPAFSSEWFDKYFLQIRLDSVLLPTAIHGLSPYPTHLVFFQSHLVPQN